MNFFKTIFIIACLTSSFSLLAVDTVGYEEEDEENYEEDDEEQPLIGGNDYSSPSPLEGLENNAQLNNLIYLKKYVNGIGVIAIAATGVILYCLNGEVYF